MTPYMASGDDLFDFSYADWAYPNEFSLSDYFKMLNLFFLQSRQRTDKGRAH
jgi:hypothetical protein